jgi:hypothetical protein
LFCSAPEAKKTDPAAEQNMTTPPIIIVRFRLLVSHADRPKKFTKITKIEISAGNNDNNLSAR